MEKICIFSDSTCDITHEEQERWNIDIVPIQVTVDDKTYREFYDITPQQYWDILLEHDEVPVTAQVSVEEFMRQFVKAKDEGCTHCLGTIINGKGSGTYQTACIVRDMFYEEHGTQMKIELIDSRTYSYIYGGPLVEAAKLRAAGASFDDIVADLNDRLNRCRAYLGVYNLKHLRKSGRISGGTAFVGDALGMKPISLVFNGSVDVCAKARGDKNLVPKLVELVKRDVVNPQEQTAHLMFTKTSEEYIDNAEQLLREAGFADVVRDPLGMAVTTNSGPQSIAVVFYGASCEELGTSV